MQMSSPPPCGGGLGGGDETDRAPVKRHPVDGAYDRARALRQNMTDAERSIWRILRSVQMDGQRFRRQVPFGQYIAPSLTLPRSRGKEGWGCHNARLIIEIDGDQHERSSP